MFTLIAIVLSLMAGAVCGFFIAILMAMSAAGSRDEEQRELDGRL